MFLDNKIEAVLPLVLRDYERFLLLHCSLSLFFQPLVRCWIVVPDMQFTELNKRIQKLKSHFSYCVIRETELIPQFKYYKIRGWFRQQLIKLAIAQLIETKFYITLDSDIVLIRKIVYSDLIQNDRARCSLEPITTHKEWYQSVLGVLKIRSIRSNGHNVTPAIFHRNSVLSLQKHLHNLSLKNTIFYSCFHSLFFRYKYKKHFILISYDAILRNLIKSILWKSYDWKCYLIRTLPWTESALYYTFMEELNHFNDYHYYDDVPLYSCHSLWTLDQIKNWTPEKAFKSEEKSLFLVIQSNTGIDPKFVWKKLEKHLIVE